MRSMVPILIGTTLALFDCLAVATAQTAGAPAFEVASVKPSPPPPAGQYPRTLVRGGPGSSDPGMATFEDFDMLSLLTMAYDIPSYRLSGPDWLSATRFEIAAKIPPGATREQYRLMLQGLLAERFKLALHHESKVMQTYELQIGKNGSKLKESPVDPTTVDPGLQPPPRLASPPRGYNGAMRMVTTNQPMERLVATLSGHLGQPVTDATGLKGNYNFRLHYTLGLQAAGDEADNSEPTIFDAVQEQLGLKLVKKSAPVDILVIDHLEKLPTQN